jgi:hypothetical protein
LISSLAAEGTVSLSCSSASSKSCWAISDSSASFLASMAVAFSSWTLSAALSSSVTRGCSLAFENPRSSEAESWLFSY